MTGASSEGRSQQTANNRTPHGAPKLRLLSRASFSIAGVAALVSALLIYRLVVLSTSQMPKRFPGGWLLDVSGVLVKPFSNYEHTPGMTKETGFVDFPALVGLEAAFFVLFIFVVLGYLFYLLQPPPEIREPAPKPQKVRRPSRVKPFVRNTAAGGFNAVVGVGASGVAVVRRQDWDGYRTEAVTTSKRGYEAYVAGVKRDAASMSRQWAAFVVAAKPVIHSSRLKLRRSMRRAQVSSVRVYRASAAWLAQAEARIHAGLSSLGAGAGRTLERSSGWYWGNFDAASNRVAALVSKRTEADSSPPASEAPTPSSEAQTDDQQLSRREFFRRIRPLR